MYRARSRSGEYIKYSTVTGTSYTNTSYIEDGNTYYYKVRALDANGTAGAWSSVVSVTYRKPAAATVASGKCGDSAKWTLDAAGTLTISGTGATYDFFNDYNCTAPWYDAELRLQIKKAVVNKGITYVGTYAFRDCAELTSVSLPAGLEEMGSSVFRYCESLTSITIPAGVTSIGGDFFYGCASLKSVTLPDSLWDAGGCTFMDCASLTSVRLPANLRDIAWWMFKDCTSLTSVTIPRGTVEVKKEAFDGCTSLKNVTFTGSAADWKGVTIRPGNTALTSAAIKCTGSTVLTAPTLTLSVSKKGQPTLKWSAVSGAAGYQLWCSYDGGDDGDPYYRWFVNNDKTATSYTVPTDYLEKGRTYTYKVRAVTSSGAVGSFSKEVTFTYNPAASLAAPTVTGGNDAQGRPTLKWNAVTGAAKYEVYRARSRSGEYIKYSTVTGTSYTNTSYIENGNTYYYKVRALDANGTAGAWSSIVSVTYRKPAAATVAGGMCGDSGERALEAAPESFEATYTLGTALYKAERFDKAEQTMRKAAADSLRADGERAEAFYNLGNAQFKQQKYKEALESYKQSLRLNPADQQAKYNYAYTKRLIDDNEDGGGGGDDDKNQDKDQNQDQQQQGNGQDKQDGDQQQDDKGQKGDDQEQQGDRQQDPSQPDKEGEGDQEGQQQPVPAGISPQEQEQMLDAIQAQEDRTQDKLKEKQGVVVRGTKNW